jgi:hypothetical protein
MSDTGHTFNVKCWCYIGFDWFEKTFFDLFLKYKMLLSVNSVFGFQKIVEKIERLFKHLKVHFYS